MKVTDKLPPVCFRAAVWSGFRRLISRTKEASSGIRHRAIGTSFPHSLQATSAKPVLAVCIT